MSYDPRFMALHAGAGAAKVWSYYSATDSKASVQLVTYFVSIWQQLTVGDRIHCHCGGQIFDLAVTAVTASAISTQASLNYA
jgi:hypothetical protein